MASAKMNKNRRPVLRFVVGLFAVLMICAAGVLGWVIYDMRLSGREFATSVRSVLERIREGSHEIGDAIAGGQAKFRATLYFATEDGIYLKSEKRIVMVKDTPEGRAKAIVKELVRGPKEPELVATLPQGTKLRELYIVDDCAVVDFNGAVQTNHPGGLSAEQLTIFSVVDSLIRQVPGIERVQLLVNGDAPETLAGHVDCTRPFRRDVSLLTP